jgi:putative ABC transport system permease protein
MRKREPMWRRYARFFGPSVEADVDDELRDHLARMEADLRAHGVPEAEIAAAVRHQFGDIDAVRTDLERRDGRRLRLRTRIAAAGNLGQDVAYALRRLKQRPGFTAAVVVVLALGVGATTAMFSAVDAAMLRPLPFAAPRQLLLVNQMDVPFDPGPGQSYPSPFHILNYNDLAAMRGTFSSVAAYAAGGLNLSDPGRPLRIQVGVVTASFFPTLGVRAREGRTFLPAEGKPGAPASAVLSYGLWVGHYGGRPMIDSMIVFNGKRYTVVGIMPRGFGFPNQSDAWIPMTNPTTFETFAAFRGYMPSYTLARLADGVTPDEAIERLHALWTRAASTAAAADTSSRSWFKERFSELGQSGFAVPLQRSLVGSTRTALLVLLGATALLLLIACVNVTNLLLSEAAVRRREIAVRAVLGATSGRLIRQLLTESVLLALAGTGLGVLVAPVVLRLVSRMLPAPLAGLAPAEIDVRVLAFAAALALITGIGFGLWPALGSARADLGETIKGAAGRGATGAGSGRVRRGLVAAEFALAIMLLIGTGLTLRSFARLMAVDSGMHPARVGTLEMSFGADAGNRTQMLAILDRIVGRLQSAPGIEAAGVVNDLPLRGGGGIGLTFHAEGTPEWKPGSPIVFARYLIASGGYFKAMGIPLVRGRTFRASDDSLAPRVAVIDQVMADSVWPGQDPVGRRFTFGIDTLHPVTVVGVVAGVHDRSLAEPPYLQMYFPISQGPPANVAIVARGTLPPKALLARLTDAVHAVDPAQAVYRVRMMDDVVGASVAPQRTNALLITMFGALALVLTSLGVYAVVAYSVAQRRRELGIRAALGATRAHLTALVAREMAWVAAVGLALGLAGAWAASRVMSSLLFGVGTHDPATYVAAPLALIVPAMLAMLIPARRASRTNPMDVIREE